MAVSTAQIKATAKYEAKTYDKTLIRLPKGRLDEIRAHIEPVGESLNGFIGRAILEAMERDGGGIVPTSPQQPAETAQGAGMVSLMLGAARQATESEGGSTPNKAVAAQSLFSVLGNLGDVDLDESRGERLGAVSLPPDAFKAAQESAGRTGETVSDFVARAVTEQQKRDDNAFKLGINPA